MALQSSGPISLAQIRGEFGGSIPDSMSEYYRGGAHVDSTPDTASIPLSGAISISNFYGTAATVYEYPYANYNTYDSSNTTQSIDYVFNSATFNQGSGYAGTPFSGPTVFGVLSLAGVNTYMPAFVGGWESTLEGNWSITFSNKTTGMRDIYWYDNWHETTVSGLGTVTYLDENWTTNFYNSINNQNQMILTFS